MLRGPFITPGAAGWTLLLVVPLLGSGCAASSASAPPTTSELRLPGLPWGSTTPEVTAALVERGFRYAGREAATGDLRFAGGELLGFEAGLVARMHGDRLVKVVAFLEPRSPDPDQDVAAIVETLAAFYGPPTGERDDPAWIRRRADGRTHGVVLRTTPRAAYRLDVESADWPEVLATRRAATLRYATAATSET